jgi:hypothetical protein
MHMLQTPSPRCCPRLLVLRMGRSGLFNFENEPIWLIHDSHSFLFFNLFGRSVSVIRDIRAEIFERHQLFEILAFVSLSWFIVRRTPNGRLRPNAATTVDYRVGLTPVHRVAESNIGRLVDRSRDHLTFSRTDETKREVLRDRLFHIFSFKSLTMASLHVFAHISKTLSRFSIIQQMNIT